MYPYDFGNSFGNCNNFNPYTMGNCGQNSNAYGQQFQNGQNQQTQQSVGCGLDIVTVQTVQQVDQVQVNPAQRRLVMVQNEPVVAMRSADNMGIVTTEYYQLVKFDPTARTNVQPVDNNKYVTEEQLESRLKEFMKNFKTNEKGVLTNESTSRNDE